MNISFIESGIRTKNRVLHSIS